MNLNDTQVIFNPFAPYVGRTFKVITIDPPWHYDNYLCKDHGAVRAHYPTMTFEELVNLKIDLGWGPCRPIDLADPEGCALVCWVTAPKIEEGIPLMRAWGFPVVTKLFTWRKTYENGNDYCGLGYYTRSDHEECWLGLSGEYEDAWMGRIGKVTPQSRKVRQTITAPVREHSRKPDEFYSRVEELWGPPQGQYLEVFARSERPGWVSYGNDIKWRVPT